MAKEKKDLRAALRAHKFEFDLLQRIPCSKQENKEYQSIVESGGTLPEGVFSYLYESGETSTVEFYTVYETDLTESEIQEYLTYKQLSLLRTIKNCVVFFTVLAAIALAGYLLIMLASL